MYYSINVGGNYMNILRIKRKQMDLTLEEMSKKLNITKGALANYEKDGRRPRFSEIWKIKMELLKVVMYTTVVNGLVQVETG